jgi:hypothetical protein
VRDSGRKGLRYAVVLRGIFDAYILWRFSASGRCTFFFYTGRRAIGEHWYVLSASDT